jgi:ribosomal-protein-alanine N-acetyltransferase
MKVRGFLREDLPAILAIQADCPGAAEWRDEDYWRLAADPGGIILVAELESETPPRIAGFAAFHRVMDEAELRNLAVDPPHQRRGIGKALLEAAANRLLQAGAKRLFLEVRASNEPARRLYHSLGFELRSTRKDYYRDPTEDALVMERWLSAPLEHEPVS